MVTVAKSFDGPIKVRISDPFSLSFFNSLSTRLHFVPFCVLVAFPKTICKSFGRPAHQRRIQVFMMDW